MEHKDNDIAFVKVKSAFKGVQNMAKLPPHPVKIIGMNRDYSKLKSKAFVILTLIHMAMASDKPSLHSFCSHFQENKATTIRI